MSDQLFEVAFSGEISAGADLAEVKSRVAKMFNADEAKLAQLFSGNRIVIKKNVDHATAMKYKTALNRAGAECEIKSPEGADSAPAAARVPTATTSSSSVAESTTEAAGGGVEDLMPPQTDPLGITGDQIEDLAVSIAPVGSQLLDEHEDVEEPKIDLSGIDIAPVGSDLSTAPREPDPEPPDTTGITLAD